MLKASLRNYSEPDVFPNLLEKLNPQYDFRCLIYYEACQRNNLSAVKALAQRPHFDPNYFYSTRSSLFYPAEVHGEELIKFVSRLPSFDFQDIPIDQQDQLGPYNVLLRLIPELKFKKPLLLFNRALREDNWELASRLYPLASDPGDISLFETHWTNLTVHNHRKIYYACRFGIVSKIIDIYPGLDSDDDKELACSLWGLLCAALEFGDANASIVLSNQIALMDDRTISVLGCALHLFKYFHNQSYSQEDLLTIVRGYFDNKNDECDV